MTSTIDVGPGAVELRASVGVAWTNEALNADAFIEQADRAMYESKRAGTGGVTMLADKRQQDHKDITRAPSRYKLDPHRRRNHPVGDHRRSCRS